MKTFLGALATCKSINSEDPRVLFLDGRLQLMMLAMSEEHKTIINAQAHPKMLPEADLAMAETKLRKAIKLHPTISGHMILALVLLELDKVVEVKQVVESGLTLKKETRADEYAALQLEKVKSFLAEEAREAKSKGFGSAHPSSMNLG